MTMRFLLLVVVTVQVSSKALPDSPPLELGGFQPLHGARGTGPSSGYAAPPSPTPSYSSPAPVPSAGPTKTIYVNVPHHPQPSPEPLPPIAGGPPRKHYKIVFIRAPPPPPAPRPILPPNTERKTIIYVLHQRPELHQQQVIQVPSVQHEPEVFFLQYDKTPSAEDLQKLSTGNLEGYTVSAQPARGDGAVNRISALVSDEASFELDDVTGFPGSGSVEIPLSGFGGTGAGVPLPSLANRGATPSPSPAGGVPLPSLANRGVTPTPSPAGGVPLPTLQGGITRVPLSSAGSTVGVPLRDASASIFPSSTTTLGPSAGSGLLVIGDDVVRPLGNTGLFQEVDSLENDYDDSLENRLALAAFRTGRQAQTGRT